MGLKIRRTGASDYGQATKLLIAGFPGAGKTLVSSTWPDPFYASAEGGLMSIADRDVPFADVRTISDLLKLKVALDQPADMVERLFGFRIGTVVVDTIDEVQRILIRERLEETKKDQLQLGDWNYIAEQMSAIVRGFRNLNMHVIFTCHLKEVTDQESGRTSYKPQMQGGFADQIAANVDLALLLKTSTKTEVINNKPEKVTRRVLQTQPDLAYEWIKDRSGKLEREIEVDFQTDFSRINEAIFGGPRLEEHDAQEIEVELPELEAIRPASEAVTRPIRKGRPAVSRPTVTPSVTPPPAGLTGVPSDPRTLVPENTGPVATGVKYDFVEPLDATDRGEEPAEVPQAEPEVVEEDPTGIKVLNPEKYMPAKSVDLTPKGFGTDLYCQSCGSEIETQKRAELAMIRFRQYFCDTCFTDKKR